MSAIDPTSQLLAYIRTEAQNWRREVARSGRPATPSPSANTPRGSEDLLTRVAQAVVAIDPDDPQRKKRPSGYIWVQFWRMSWGFIF